MSRKKYFIIGVLFMTLLNILDLLSTWLGTPDLKLEMNPLVREYGAGWGGIILFAILFQSIITIPFYYHCLVFNYPDYKYKRNFRFKFIIEIYFFRNHKNPYLSVGKGLFNGFGFYLFWKYIIIKSLAILSNILSFFGSHFFGIHGYREVDTEMAKRHSGSWFYSIVERYWYFSSKMILLNRIQMVFIFIALAWFIRGIEYKARNNIKREKNDSTLHLAFIFIFIILYLFTEFFFGIGRNSLLKLFSEK